MPQIQAELNSVKGICNGLNKYYDDVKEMVKQVEEAVKNANKSNTNMNVTTEKFKCPYKWKCKTCNLTFCTTTNLYDHKKVSMKIQDFHAGKINCDKTFAHQSSRRIHEMKHKKEKSKCDQCCKLFYHESELEIINLSMPIPKLGDMLAKFVLQNQNFNTVPHFSIITVNFMYKTPSKHVYIILLHIFLSDCKI